MGHSPIEPPQKPKYTRNSTPSTITGATSKTYGSETVGEGETVDPDFLIIDKVQIDLRDNPIFFTDVDVVGDSDSDEEMGLVFIGMAINIAIRLFMPTLIPASVELDTGRSQQRQIALTGRKRNRRGDNRITKFTSGVVKNDSDAPPFGDPTFVIETPSIFSIVPMLVGSANEQGDLVQVGPADVLLAFTMVLI